MKIDPHEEYEKRRDCHVDSLAHLDKQSLLVANLRLFVFTAAVAGGWWSFTTFGEFEWWVWGLSGGFLALIVIHSVIETRRDQARFRIDYYQAGLDRLNHHWKGKGRGRKDLIPRDHLCAEDLDVFGTGSLFERLNTTSTFMGEECLAKWLLEGAEVPTLVARQEAVREVNGEVTLRESLALCAQRAGADPSEKRLSDWARRPSPVGENTTLFGALVLTVSGVGAAWAAFADVGGGAPLLIWGFAVWGAHRLTLSYRGAVSLGLEGVSGDLRSLGFSLVALGDTAPRSRRLKELKGELTREGRPAQVVLRSLERLVVLKDAKRNQLAAPFVFFLLTDLYLSVAIERWRIRYGSELSRWLLGVGEWDALLAMGAYTFENPDAVFPEFPEEGAESPAVFAGTQLRHPLLPRQECVPSDVVLGTAPAVWMVSGSNMSGKSTLLRTVGSNILLALLGAPVHAGSLTLTPVTVGATLRIHDSLSEGQSRFFAEVTRLGRMLEETKGPRPLLFLVDEIFHGTNSGDRSLGAVALVTELLKRGAIGLVTTHDLALASGVESLSPGVSNVHLRDSVRDGELFFDYTVYPGVLVHSNALHLMRAVGLPV